MITDVPGDRPDTKPEASTLSTELLSLLHMPPEVPSTSVIALPAHRLCAPPIDAGWGFTVIVAALKQPVLSVYLMLTVPGNMLKAIPDVLTVAMDVLALLHAPPVIVSVRATDAAGQMAAAPVMAAGSGLTVNIAVLIHPVPMV